MEREVVSPEAMGVLPLHRCWALLRSSEVGRLAVVTPVGPDVFPVNFVVDGGSIVLRTTEGTKLASIAADERVAFEVDGGDRASGQAWSVVAKGPARVIEDCHELFDVTGLALFPWDVAPKHRFVRIEPHTVTGREFAVVAQAHWGDEDTARRTPDD